MRRLLMSLLFVVLLFGLTTSASAGWRYVGRHIGHHGHHIGRHVGYRGHYVGYRGWRVGHWGHHSWNRWAYRPLYRPHFVSYRYPIYRSYGYSAYGFYGNPWFGAVQGYVAPVRYSYPSVYYAAPYCASYTPSPAETSVGSKIIEFAEQDRGTEALLASYRTQSPVDVASLTGHARQVNYGDRLFGGSFYGEALRKYDAASQLAPESAEVQFRRGFALIALEQYGQAAAAFKQGLALDASYAPSAGQLATLYGQAGSKARTGHLEAMAGAALSSEPDADLLFVIGLFLHCEGQSQRAAPFFQQAAELASGDAPHLQPFLNPVPAPSKASQLRDKLASFGFDMTPPVAPVTTPAPAPVQVASLRR